MSKFIKSIKRCDIEEVKRLIPTTSIVQISHGVTIAVNYMPSVEIINLLLANGADVNYNNNSSLKNACYYSNVELIKLLIDHGAKIDTVIDLPLRSDIKEFLEKKIMLDKLKELV
jgi:hypothetical protein